MAVRLDTPIQFLKGVGPKLGSIFNRRGLHTVGDLLEFYPKAYQDQRAVRNIASLKADELVSLKVQMVQVNVINLGQTHRKMYLVRLRDDSGHIEAKYFKVPYRGYFDRMQPYSMVRVEGRVISYRGKLEFHHPDIKDVEIEDEIKDELHPIYVEIDGLSSHRINKIILNALDEIELSGWPPDLIPQSVLDQYSLIEKKKALVSLHRPPVSDSHLFFGRKSNAQRRIIFEEFFWLELFLATRKIGLQLEISDKIQNQNKLVKKLLETLPFKITQAQWRVFNEIREDLISGKIMYRLVQGDVGCGKTMIGFMAALVVAESEKQTCLMVPTEILAGQHYKNALLYLKPLGLRVALLTGKTKTLDRSQILKDLFEGSIDLLIGTHSLIEDEVKFAHLGLVLIDEQHRFGVEQRSLLKKKGKSPHFLVMTATPIPRTLSLTVYGDLDVSIVDELPPGRSPIQTRVAFENKRPRVFSFMVEQIQKGRQVYIVYPLVEESEKIDLKNATQEFENLKKQFPKVSLGLLHGKMASDEKELIMSRFRNGEIKILVSTTVIEVGVDVPNANMIIIEHAERFGLSQLHQLRGRIGRGEHKSFCILMLGHAVSDEAKKRVEMMEKTNDGFKIAEFDLEMRGPGEFLGTRQSGLEGFKMAQLSHDASILLEAREAAFSLIKKDPYLQNPAHRSLREEIFRQHGPLAFAGIG